jgi:aspartate-semialdehyde dehydrogenase
VLVFRPVNVNEAVTRVRVPLVHAVEPKNARRNEVFCFWQRIARAERDAGFEDCSRFGVVADFFYDAKVTERRFHAPFLSPDSKARTGNGIGTERFAIAGQREALIPNGNVDLGSRALHQSRAALQFAPVKKQYHIAVVGATGAVGAELLRVLERRNFPTAKIRALASGKSAGRKVRFRNESIIVEELGVNSFDKIDVAFFSAGGDISRKFVPIARNAGAVVIDNSSVFRMDPDVPLVIPEINGQDVKQHRGLIANPNCTTAVALMAIYPLHRAFGVRRVFAASYQAVSGSGARAIDELKKQVEAAAHDRQTSPQVYPHPIAFNVLPHVDVFLESGYTKEEMKMQNEGRKIMHLPEFRASVTCVRVPVYRAHSVAVSAEFEKKVSVEQAREVLAKAPGLELVDEPQKNRYPMPLNVAGKDNCEVGRVRLDCALENGLAFWVSGDQLLKGAALNAVQIAELL